MKIEKFASEINQNSESGINTLPVLSLLMILIPFLLLTTVFVDTSVFELHLPVKGKSKTAGKTIPLSAPGLFIFADGKGLRIGAGGTISGYFGADDLYSRLRGLKDKFEKRGDITLASSPEIRYQKIIDIVTISNEVGFDQITVADEKSFFKNKPVANQDF